MKKTVDGIKWVSISITVAVLVTVFWVWPAWNAGPQTWYMGNNEGLTNPMYRNAYPPVGQNAPFQIAGSFEAFFRANEAANQMLNFGPDPWQYQIEWYLDDPTFMPMGMEMVMYSLTIGKWRGGSMGGMSMMAYTPLFSAMGSGLLGSMASPFVVKGSALPLTGMMLNFAFMPGDILGAMVGLMTFDSSMMLADIHLVGPLANTWSITSAFSDPGYPGFAMTSVPTLSQWGMLALAILLSLLYPFVMRRRMRMRHS
jgi:hypothetical protein